MAEAPRLRKNIDSLTDDHTDELANYIYALQKLYDKSSADPDSIDGYTYFEQLHDGAAGPCEHANDTFLPWHRAQLYLFEEALRRSDPPRTANVTIPYWDWSAPPSGKRFPKAFEDTQSILYHRGRSTGANPAAVYSWQYLQTNLLNKPNWSSPVGGNGSTPLPPSFGGGAGGESDCSSAFGKQWSAVENPYHNDIHSRYVGGAMGNPSAAATDPIFWSFHAFVDLLWWQWQQDAKAGKHPAENTDLDARLCGLYSDRAHQPQNRYRVRDVLDTESQLSYTYEFTPPPAPSATLVRALSVGQFFEVHPVADFVLSGQRAPELIRTLDITIPQPGFKISWLLFNGINVPAQFSYEADIYLTPRFESFRPHSRAFRRRYLVDLLSVWQLHHHSHPMTHMADHGGHDASSMDVRTINHVVDVRRAFEALSHTHTGEQWRIWVALTPFPSRPMPGMAAAPVAPASTGHIMNFRDMTLYVE